MALGGDARSTNPQLRWPHHRAKGPRWQRRKQANPTGDAEASGRAVTKGFHLRSMKDAFGRPRQKQSFRKDCEIKLYPFSATISRRPDRSIGSGFLEACPRTCGKRPGPSARLRRRPPRRRPRLLSCGLAVLQKGGLWQQRYSCSFLLRLCCTCTSAKYKLHFFASYLEFFNCPRCRCYFDPTLNA